MMTTLAFNELINLVKGQYATYRQEYRYRKSHMTKLMKSPNGHIFADLLLILRRNSTWKVRGNYIDFERRIHVEIMTSIRRGYFDVDLTFKIDEILMSSRRGFFYVVLTSNRRTHCFHSIIF